MPVHRGSPGGACNKLYIGGIEALPDGVTISMLRSFRSPFNGVSPGFHPRRFRPDGGEHGPFGVPEHRLILKHLFLGRCTQVRGTLLSRPV